MFDKKNLTKGAVVLSIILLTFIIVLLSNSYEVHADSWFDKEGKDADEFELFEHYNSRAIEVLQGDLPESGDETYHIMRFNRLLFEELDMLYETSLEDQGKAIRIAYILNPYEQMPGDYSDVQDIIKKIENKDLRTIVDKLAKEEAGDIDYENYEEDYDEDYLDDKIDNPLEENSDLEKDKSNSPSILKLMIISILLIIIVSVIVFMRKKG